MLFRSRHLSIARTDPRRKTAAAGIYTHVLAQFALARVCYRWIGRPCIDIGRRLATGLIAAYAIIATYSYSIYLTHMLALEFAIGLGAGIVGTLVIC